jgi:hypothetical protein
LREDVECRGTGGTRGDSFARLEKGGSQIRAYKFTGSEGDLKVAPTGRYLAGGGWNLI